MKILAIAAATLGFVSATKTTFHQTKVEYHDEAPAHNWDNTNPWANTNTWGTTSTNTNTNTNSGAIANPWANTNTWGNTNPNANTNNNNNGGVITNPFANFGKNTNTGGNTNTGYARDPWGGNVPTNQYGFSTTFTRGGPLPSDCSPDNGKNTGIWIKKIVNGRETTVPYVYEGRNFQIGCYSQSGNLLYRDYCTNNAGCNYLICAYKTCQVNDKGKIFRQEL